MIRRNEGEKVFICGGEESYGFNVGAYVRDKDAVVTCLLAAEVACWAASRGLTMYDLLKEMYVRFGFFKERMVSRTLKGKDGMQQMVATMNRFRENPPGELLGSPVLLIHDYRKGETVDMISELRYKINLPASDVIQFVCADNTVVTIRPSGTEPKIKYYFGVRTQLDRIEDYDVTDRILEDKLTELNGLFQK